MKTSYLLILAGLLALSPSLWANSNLEFIFFHKNLNQEFKFHLKQGAQFEDAFETAAMACLNHFKKQTSPDTEDARLDLIDTCANPIVKN